MTEYSNLIQRLVKTIFRIKYHAENLINIYITQFSAVYINPACFFILLLLIPYLWKRICITLVHANVSCSDVLEQIQGRSCVNSSFLKLIRQIPGNDLCYACPSEITFERGSFNYLIFPQLFTKNKLLCNISQ